MPYIEAYVLPVTASKLDAYKDIARKSGAMWKAHGALSVTEAVGSGLEWGKQTSFPRSVELAGDEVVVWSYITFHDKAHRDKVMESVLADTAFTKMMEDVPVDGKRMIWGGFETFLD
jgi:uncharacterized protein YbaA (DUF1428 family)